MTETPNPGSPEAVENGCTCPVLDNGYGNDEIGKIRGFWITQGCPLHDKTNDDDDSAGYSSKNTEVDL